MTDPVDLLEDLVDAVEVFMSTTGVYSPSFIDELHRAREYLNRKDDEAISHKD